MKKAIAAMDTTEPIELEMKAFQLDPNAPRKSVGNMTDLFVRKYGFSPDEAEKRIDSITAMGRQEGLNFNFVDAQFVNTVDAHRLTKYAQSKEPPSPNPMFCAVRHSRQVLIWKKRKK